MLQIFLDTETTGVEIGACIVELAAIMVEDGEIIDTFHKYSKPYRQINAKAYEAHHISMEFLNDKPEEKEVLDSFIEWFLGMGKVDEVLAYNANFDMRIINDRIKLDRLMEEDLINKQIVKDVASLAKQALKKGIIGNGGRRWNQEYIASLLGIQYNAHSAIEDVKAMMAIYKKLQYLLR